MNRGFLINLAFSVATISPAFAQSDPSCDILFERFEFCGAGTSWGPRPQLNGIEQIQYDGGVIRTANERIIQLASGDWSGRTLDEGIAEISDRMLLGQEVSRWRPFGDAIDGTSVILTDDNGQTYNAATFLLIDERLHLISTLVWVSNIEDAQTAQMEILTNLRAIQ